MRIPIISLQDVAGPLVPDVLARRAWAMLSHESYFLLTDTRQAFPGIDESWDAVKRYFNRPIGQKLADHIANSADHHGYVPMGEEGKSGDDADYKESYDCGWYAPTKPGQTLTPHWPDVVGFGDSVQLLWRQMREVAAPVGRLLSRMLGEDEVFLELQAKEPPSQLRLLHYAGDDAARLAVDWHTDYECFTLLTSTAPGLDVRRRDGSIVQVPHLQESLIVTVGDLVEVITNGGLPATDHRVRVLSEERYSIAFFYAFDWTAQVRPLPQFVGPSGLHYPEILAGDHLLRRTNDGFRYRRTSADRESLADLANGSDSPYFYLRDA